jgi:signal transduction histidine kinase
VSLAFRLTQLRRSAAILPLAAAGALLLLGISETAYRSASASLSDLRGRDLVRQQVHKVLRGLTDAETGQRGYLITARPEYLDPYRTGVRDVNEGLAALTAASDVEAARPIINELHRASLEKLSELEEVLRLYDAGNTNSWRALISSHIAQEKMASVRESASALLGTISTNIDRERADVARTLMLSRIGIGGLSAFSLLAFVMVLRQTAMVDEVRTRLAVEVEAERDLLEAEVLRRTNELTELTRHLHSVREDERHHLARELHDELGALLTAAKLDAARLKRSLAGSVAGAEERLAHLGATLDSGIALKRRIIEDLRPSSLSNLGLKAALEIQAREFASCVDAKVSIDVQEVELSEGAQIAIYRLVQESLTNVAKYAQARHVAVSLGRRDDRIVVSVRDDGKGFDTQRVGSSTHGLIGMRYRVEAHGGSLRVQSTPGAGTLVEATLPAHQATG